MRGQKAVEAMSSGEGCVSDGRSVMISGVYDGRRGVGCG